MRACPSSVARVQTPEHRQHSTTQQTPDLPAYLQSTIFRSSLPVRGVQPGSRLPNRDSRSRKGANTCVPYVVKVSLDCMATGGGGGGGGAGAPAGASSVSSFSSSSPRSVTALSPGAAEVVEGGLSPAAWAAHSVGVSYVRGGGRLSSTGPSSLQDWAVDIAITFSSAELRLVRTDATGTSQETGLAFFYTLKCKR